MNSPAVSIDELPDVSVTTGARLHFGLFDVKAPFGGIGLMVDHPRTIVNVSAADSFATRPCAVERIAQIARRIAAGLPASLTADGLPRCLVTVDAAADSHCGLGSGTQLGLAAATAISEFFSLASSRYELAHEFAARGRRSSIGSLGFFYGGLIEEDGSEHQFEPCSSWRRATVPAQWRVVIACPIDHSDVVFGEAEGAAFAKLAAASTQYRAELVQQSKCIMNAAVTNNFDRFSASVTQFNRLSGAFFATHQGGCYNGETVSKLVNQFQQLGVQGVGQSSWGPSVFGFCRSADEAQQICRSLNHAACRIVQPQLDGYILQRSL